MTFHTVFQALFKQYGPQNWWPGDTPFEVMVGAVLTQNTAWTNVEKAIANLKQNNVLDAASIANMAPSELAELIRPAGYFNVKAKRMQNFCRWYIEQGEETVLAKWDDHTLRHGLLSVNGVGPETADDIVLYAFNRPVFVIDAYTRRLFSRLALVECDEGYETLRHLFERTLHTEKSTTEELVQLFNEYHALIVIHAKDVCRKRPLCQTCCLTDACPRNGVE